MNFDELDGLFMEIYMNSLPMMLGMNMIVSLVMAYKQYDVEIKSELDLSEPSEHIMDWARENIGENLYTRDEVVSEFKNMINELNECIPHRLDDKYLLRFLRSRFFDLEDAHRLICSYYEFKGNNPDFFLEVTLDDLEYIGDDEIITVPPYREQTGRRMIIYRLDRWDPEKVSIEEIFKATLIVMELAILEPSVQILGGICIFDLGGLNLKHIWYLTPTVVNKIYQILVNSFPIRVHALHFVNGSWLFMKVYNIYKSWIGDYLLPRIHLHGEDFESLHQYISPEYLPKRYGGVHPDHPQKEWYDGIKRNKEILWELNSLGYNYAVEDNDKKDEL